MAIHEKICPLVALLSSPQPHASSQEERRHREHQQELRKVGESEGQRKGGRELDYTGMDDTCTWHVHSQK